MGADAVTARDSSAGAMRVTQAAWAQCSEHACHIDWDDDLSTDVRAATETPFMRVVSAALAAFAAQAAARMRERCAQECERVWRETPNERPHYRQNAVSYGCSECAAAIRALPREEPR